MLISNIYERIFPKKLVRVALLYIFANLFNRETRFLISASVVRNEKFKNFKILKF